MPDTVVLIITDRIAHAASVAKKLEVLKRRIVVHDVLDGGADPDIDRAVVVTDLSFAKPDAVVAARNLLNRLSWKMREHICLISADTGHDRIQANALGAGRIVCLASGLDGLVAALAPLLPRLWRNAYAPRSVNAASETFHDIMVASSAGGRLDPELVSTGTEFITAALSEVSIRKWMEIVWLFDDVTHSHCLLVAGLAAAFSSHLGFSRNDAQRLTRGALLHDVGKARIPVAILNKPGPLDAGERKIINTHPMIGWEALSTQGYDAEALSMVRSHHEMLDGTGYPDGLKGAEIPDIVRLLTICDIFAALIERRPYKRPMSPEESFAILERMSMEGKLDAALVRAYQPLAFECEPLRAAS